MSGDELADRRLPDWARQLRGIKLGGSIAVTVMPHRRWIEESAGKPYFDCPEHLLMVSVAVIGHEEHPSALNPDPETWKRAAFPIAELACVPWLEWRKRADAHLNPASEADA